MLHTALKKHILHLIINAGFFLAFLILLELMLQILAFGLDKKFYSKIKLKPDDNQITFLCLGDSYTVGGLGPFEESYPELLEDKLAEEYNTRYCVLNGGVCEANSTQILHRFKKIIKLRTIDTLILLVGSANRYNFVGYDVFNDRKRSFFKNLKIAKMTKIILVNLRGKTIGWSGKKKNHEPNNYKTHRTDNINIEEMIPRLEISAYDRAKKLYSAGRFKKAEDIFISMVDRYPDKPFAYLITGNYFFARSKFKKAEELYRKGIALFPAEFRFYYFLAWNYVKQYEYQISETMFRPDGKLEPLQGYSYYFTDDKPISEKMINKIEHLFLKANELAPGNSFILAKLASFYRSQHKFKEAEALLNNILKNDPDNIYARNGLIFTYLIQKKRTEADILIKRQIIKLKNEGSNPFMLGMLYTSIEEYDMAESAFKEAIKKEPGFSRAHVALSNVYSKKGLYEKEKDTLHNAIDLCNEKKDIYSALFHLALRNAQAEDVVKYALERIRTNPLEFHKYYTGIKAFLLQSKYSAEDILKFFDDIIQEDPDLKENKIFYYYYSFFEDREAWEEKIHDWFKSDLDSIIKLCKQNNIAVILMTYPYPYNAINRIIRESALRHSLPLVDHEAIFDTLTNSREDRKYFKDDDHCTAEGHAIIAGNILDIMKQEKIAGN